MAHSTTAQMPKLSGLAGRRSSPDDRAAMLFARARERGQCGALGSLLSARPRCLLSLGELEAGGVACAQPCEKTQSVPITQILGSESRSGDFDRDFHPLQDRTRQRWLSVAVAREQGRSLPPVELIQVGQVYFVRDGHHRISVAHALGQQTIEARVLVWQMAGPLPWEVQASGRERDAGRLHNRIQRGAVRLWESISNTVELALKSAAGFSTAAGGG